MSDLMWAFTIKKQDFEEEILDDLLNSFDDKSVVFERQVAEGDEAETCGIIMSTPEDRVKWGNKLQELGAVTCSPEVVHSLMKTDYLYFTFSDEYDSDMEYNKKLYGKWESAIRDTIIDICTKELNQRDSFEDFLKSG